MLSEKVQFLFLWPHSILLLSLFSFWYPYDVDVVMSSYLLLSLDTERWKFIFSLATSVRLQVIEKHGIRDLSNKNSMFLAALLSMLAFVCVCVLVPQGSKMVVAVLFQKWQCPVEEGGAHLLWGIFIYETLPRSPQEGFPHICWPELGHMLLPKPITGMLKGMTLISSVDVDSLCFRFPESSWREMGTWTQWGHSGNEAQDMAAGQVFTAVTLSHWFQFSKP